MDSLKSRLLNYLCKVYFRNQNLWLPKGQLEDLSKSAGYLGDNGDRRLRELCEEGKIERKQEGVSIAYRYIPTVDEIANLI